MSVCRALLILSVAKEDIAKLLSASGAADSELFAVAAEFTNLGKIISGALQDAAVNPKESNQ